MNNFKQQNAEQTRNFLLSANISCCSDIWYNFRKITTVGDMLELTKVADNR